MAGKVCEDGFVSAVKPSLGEAMRAADRVQRAKGGIHDAKTG